MAKETGPGEEQEMTPLQRYLAKQKASAPAPSQPAPKEAPVVKAKATPPRFAENPEALLPTLSQATFPPRALAYMVDWIFVASIKSMSMMVIRAVFFFVPPFALEAASNFVWVLVIFFYFGWFYSQRGASPGKLLFQLQVVEVGTGRRIGYVRTFLRETFGKFLSGSILGIGYLMAAFRKDGQALHDLLFDTRVAREVPRGPREEKT